MALNTITSKKGLSNRSSTDGWGGRPMAVVNFPDFKQFTQKEQDYVRNLARVSFYGLIELARTMNEHNLSVKNAVIKLHKNHGKATITYR
jgi:hypothetical protein